MTKQNQATETKTSHKPQPKPVPAPDPLSAELAPVDFALGPAGIQSRLSGPATPLHDPRLQVLQRQRLASQIGRMQGNGHLQQLMAFVKHNGHHSAARSSTAPTIAAEPRTQEVISALEVEALAWGTVADAPSVAGAPEPPPALVPQQPWVQRSEEEDGNAPTEAEKAAALAAAQAAEAAAAQTTSLSQNQLTRTVDEKATAQEASAAAKAKGEAVGAAGDSAAKAEKMATPALASAPVTGDRAKAVNGTGNAPVVEHGMASIPRGAEAKAPTSPNEDPAFQAVVGKVKGVAGREQSHAPAITKASEAQSAAESPASEIEGKAQANQVGAMAQAETPAFDAAGFKAQLMARIQALAPKTAEEADDFKEDNKLGGLKEEMQGKAAEERDKARDPLAEQTAAAPDTGAVEPKPVNPLAAAQPGEAPPAVGAQQAVPKVKGQSELEQPLQQDAKALDQRMADEEITEDQLAKSNEPAFQGALAAKTEAQAHAQQGPQAVRQFEQDRIAGAEAEAVATAQDRTQAMHGDRAGLLTQVQGSQEATKTKDEQARAQVAAKIQGIYNRTKSNVEKILNGLDAQVTQSFDSGAAAAKQVFEDYVDAKMTAYKEKRYGGWLGWAKWAKDKIAGMPAEVNVFYSDGRQRYLKEMDAVIDNVVAIIGSGLTKAKAEIAAGKQEIQEYVASLPQELQGVGQEAAQAIQSQFDELEDSVNSKQRDLIDTLANKYQENLQAIDARIEELKAANQGLAQKAFSALAGVIQTIMQLKDMLLNVLARVADVVGRIIKDPISFLGNLVAGVKQGLQNFVSNIGTHLKQGLIGWLTGAIAGAGIALPQNWDLPGIFQFVMQLLGLTFESLIGKVSQLFGIDIMSIIEPVKQVIEIYQADGFQGLIKAGLARLIGEERMQALLQVWDMIQTFISGNWAKLWAMIQEHLSGLKEMVFGKIEEFIGERVIKAGITWIISLLNPAGAFIKACKAIYDIVMFFIERGSQIMALVNAIIDSVGAIAGGNLGAAAGAIEGALAKGIPVAIGFLSSLLGLGNVSEKVQEIIQGVRGLVDKAIDTIFNLPPVKMVVGFIKKVIGKITGAVKGGVKWGKGKAGRDANNNPSPDVKSKARQIVASRTKEPFQSHEQLLSTVGQIEKTLQPEGLRSLDVRPKERAPGQYDIIARSSNGPDVGDAFVAPEVGLVGPNGQTPLREYEPQSSSVRKPEGPNYQPFVGKLTQAVAMFTSWARLGTSRVAQEMLRELETAREEAQALSEDQLRGIPPSQLDNRKKVLAMQLRKIQALDPKYELVSVGEMSITLTSVRRQMPVVMPEPWTVLDSSLRPEYIRQLRDQQDGMNAMTVEQWQHNRDRYASVGRSKIGARMQATFQRRMRKVPGTAAPHNPDQGASGYPDPTGEPAILEVNNHIGSQWPQRRSEIQRAIDVIDPAARLITQMNVRFEVV